MQKTVFHSTNNSIRGDEYENPLTGATLHDDVEGDRVYHKKQTGTFHIDSNNYVIFDDAAAAYLCRELSDPDYARVVKIGSMLYSDCSVVYNREKRTAHSSETLSTALNMDLNKFYVMVRKLVKKNILSYCVCAPSGYVQKIYMLNPYIIRKTKNLNCELHSFFRDVTQE
jgi:hypothetical protein